MDFFRERLPQQSIGGKGTPFFGVPDDNFQAQILPEIITSIPEVNFDAARFLDFVPISQPIEQAQNEIAPPVITAPVSQVSGVLPIEPILPVGFSLPNLRDFVPSVEPIVQVQEVSRQVSEIVILDAQETIRVPSTAELSRELNTQTISPAIADFQDAGTNQAAITAQSQRGQFTNVDLGVLAISALGIAVVTLFRLL